MSNVYFNTNLFFTLFFSKCDNKLLKKFFIKTSVHDPKGVWVDYLGLSSAVSFERRPFDLRRAMFFELNAAPFVENSVT